MSALWPAAPSRVETPARRGGEAGSRWRHRLPGISPGRPSTPRRRLQFARLSGSSLGGVYKSLSSGSAWSYAGIGLPRASMVTPSPSTRPIRRSPTAARRISGCTRPPTAAGRGPVVPTPERSRRSWSIPGRRFSTRERVTALWSQDGGATWFLIGLDHSDVDPARAPPGRRRLLAVAFGRLFQTSPPTGSCVADPTSLCLNAGRFRVVSRGAPGTRGRVRARPSR